MVQKPVFTGKREKNLFSFFVTTGLDLLNIGSKKVQVFDRRLWLLY